MGTAIAANYPQRTTSPAPTIPDVTVLFGKAVSHVHRFERPQFTRAVMLEAEGKPRHKSAKYASGIGTWTFVLDNQASKSRYRSASVTYGPSPKRFGQVKPNTQPFLEDVPIHKPPKMTLRQAVRRLRQTGHYRSVSAVTLRNPLGPNRSNPFYIFRLTNGNYVAVDTVTGKVFSLG